MLGLVTPGRANLACAALIVGLLIGFVPIIGTMVGILTWGFYLTILHGIRKTSVAIATHQQNLN